MATKPANFTPGPWFNAVETIYHNTGKDEGNGYTELVHVGEASREEDAIAMAALPDLYAALEVLVLRYTTLVPGGDCGFAEAALAKARGES